MLSNDQIHELLELIELQHLIFIASSVGMEVLTAQEQDRVKQLVEADDVNIIDLNFMFGIMSTLMSDKEANKLTFAQLKTKIKTGEWVPLNSQEKFALKAIKNFAYNDIKGLGNKIKSQFHTILIEQDQVQRVKYEQAIKEEAEKSFIKREDVKQLVSKLGHRTGDWSRDFGRISDYIMHYGFDHGRAYGFKRKYGDDVRVWKSVYPGACRHCIRLYLTKGLGSRPIVFKLNTLLQNGTNIGRKSDQWKAVIGPTHPWCRCTLEQVPNDYIWDDKTQTFQPPKTFQRKVKRRSKIEIKVGDKTTKV